MSRKKSANTKKPAAKKSEPVQAPRLHAKYDQLFDLGYNAGPGASVPDDLVGDGRKAWMDGQAYITGLEKDARCECKPDATCTACGIGYCQICEGHFCRSCTVTTMRGDR